MSERERERDRREREGEEGGATVVSLALLEGYKVRWNRRTVARDVVQNFFDAAADFDDVTIELDGDGCIRVEGPATFDLDYLRYIGATSKRDTRSAGGFGEGFKICALVLLRDYGVEVRAGSGAWEIRPFFRPMKLGRELCYEVLRREPGAAKEGSWVEIRGADDELCHAFEESRDFFRHAHNPRLAAPRHVDETAGVGVFLASDPRRGDVFYRRQHRGALAFSKGAGLTFACDDRVEGVEADRDRRGLRAPIRVVVAVLARVPTDVLEWIVRRLRPYWQDGNGVLTQALREAARRGARFAFNARWLATASAEQRLVEHAKRRGCLVAISRFADVGMQTVRGRFGDLEAPRPPTPLEVARVDVALDLYAALLGEPSPARPLRVREIPRRFNVGARRALELSATTLAGRFEDGIGDVLSELARQEGQARVHDASRLTFLIQGVLREAGRLGAYRDRWTSPAELPLAVEEDNDEPSHAPLGAPTIPMAILAPRGFPPADAIERRIRRLSRRLFVHLRIERVDVDGPEAAAREYARGIPSVWIGNVEIEPPAGTARYEVRTFAGPNGPSLCPADDVLQATLTDVTARAGKRYRYYGKRLAAGHNAHHRWLAVNRPAEYARVLEDQAIRGLVDLEQAERAVHARDDDSRYVTGPDGFAFAAARRLLDQMVAGPQEGNARWGPVKEHIGHATTCFYALRGALDELFAALPHRDQAAGENQLLERARLLAFTMSPEDAACRVLPFGAPLARLYAAAAAEPLDDTCRHACRETAQRVFFAHADGSPVGLARADSPAGSGPVEAADAAEVRLREAAAIAAERHAATVGREAPCHTLGDVLAARLDKSTRRRVPADGRGVAERGRAAWDQAVMAGVPHVEAARRYLEAATVGAAEERTKRERAEARARRRLRDSR